MNILQKKIKVSLIRLLDQGEALAKRWEGRQIMNNDLFMIYCESILRKLGDQSSPDSVRMVLVLNPT